MTNLNLKNIDELYDVFISYEADTENIISKLYENLSKAFDLKVWMDTKDTNKSDNF